MFSKLDTFLNFANLLLSRITTLPNKVTSIIFADYGWSISIGDCWIIISFVCLTVSLVLYADIRLGVVSNWPSCYALLSVGIFGSLHFIVSRCIIKAPVKPNVEFERKLSSRHSPKHTASEFDVKEGKIFNGNPQNPTELSKVEITTTVVEICESKMLASPNPANVETSALFPEAPTKQIKRCNDPEKQSCNFDSPQKQKADIQSSFPLSHGEIPYQSSFKPREGIKGFNSRKHPWCSQLSQIQEDVIKSSSIPPNRKKISSSPSTLSRKEIKESIGFERQPCSFGMSEREENVSLHEHPVFIPAKFDTKFGEMPPADLIERVIPDSASKSIVIRSSEESPCSFENYTKCDEKSAQILREKHSYRPVTFVFPSGQLLHEKAKPVSCTNQTCSSKRKVQEIKSQVSSDTVSGLSSHPSFVGRRQITETPISPRLLAVSSKRFKFSHSTEKKLDTRLFGKPNTKKLGIVSTSEADMKKLCDVGNKIPIRLEISQCLPGNKRSGSDKPRSKNRNERRQRLFTSTDRPLTKKQKIVSKRSTTTDEKLESRTSVSARQSDRRSHIRIPSPKKQKQSKLTKQKSGSSAVYRFSSAAKSTRRGTRSRSLTAPA